MSTPEILVCRYRPGPATSQQVMVKAMPYMIVVGASFGMYRNGWSWLVFLVSVAIATATWFFLRIVRRQRELATSACVEIDAQHELFTFRHCRFVASFLPEKPREVETVRFDEVIAVNHSNDQGIQVLTVRTAKGTVTVSSELEHFETLESTLDELVEANQDQEEGYARQLEAEPRIKTAWYGWIILLGVFATVLYLGWKFMYADS